MAIGKVPNKAAKVVIMIGLKRTRQASKIACSGRHAGALHFEGEVDHHDRHSFLTMPSADQADHAV